MQADVWWLSGVGMIGRFTNTTLKQRRAHARSTNMRRKSPPPVLIHFGEIHIFAKLCRVSYKQRFAMHVFAHTIFTYEIHVYVRIQHMYTYTQCFVTSSRERIAIHRLHTFCDASVAFCG